MLILYLLILQVNSQSEYQTGVQILDCSKPSVEITFPQQFQLPPQIIITQSEIYFLSNGVNFRFEIGSITNKGFTISLSCLQNVKQINIKWHAINDKRIEIINCFNRDNPKNQTYNHTNLNALNGFLSLTSFYYISSVNFYIDIIEITPFNVTVGISNTNNLKQIGYQIILGIDDAFVDLGQLTAVNDISQTISIEPNKFFISPYLGFQLTSSDAIQLIQSQDQITQPEKLIYKIYELPGDTLYSRNVHWRIWVSKTFNVFQSLRYNQIQIIQKSKINQEIIQSSIKITFDQESQIFKENGIYRVIVDKSIQFINVFFQMICQQGKKNNLEFVYCYNCKNNLLTQYTCDNKIQLIECNMELIVDSVAIQELYIVLQNSQFQIKQILYNQIIEQITLFKAYEL